MVKVDVGVLKVASQLLKLDIELHVVWVGKDELRCLHLGVSLQVHVFVPLHGCMELLVRIHLLHLVAHHGGCLAFYLTQERLNNFIEVQELCNAIRELLLFH